MKVSLRSTDFCGARIPRLKPWVGTAGACIPRLKPWVGAVGAYIPGLKPWAGAVGACILRLKPWTGFVFFVWISLATNAQDTVRYTGSTLVNVDYHNGQLPLAMGVHN